MHCELPAILHDVNVKLIAVVLCEARLNHHELEAARSANFSGKRAVRPALITLAQFPPRSTPV